MARASMICALSLLAARIAAAQAPERASAEPASSAAKIAVVVVGDADEALVAAAVRVADAVGDEVEQPADPGIRSALRGEGTDEDDGLERLRRERRSLGISEDDDIPVLARIGRMTGAVALVVVRRRGAGVEAVVMDVGRRAFFEGSVAPDADPAEVLAVVKSRSEAAARAAASLSDDDEGAEEPARAETPPDRASRARARQERPPPQVEEEEEEEDGSFIDDAWPLLVGALLLIGTIVLFVLPDDPADPAPPVLRFIPGGS